MNRWLRVPLRRALAASLTACALLALAAPCASAAPDVDADVGAHASTSMHARPVLAAAARLDERGDVRLSLAEASLRVARDDASGLSVRAGRFAAGLPWLAAARTDARGAALAPIVRDVSGVELREQRDGWSASLARVMSEWSRGFGSSRSPGALARFADTYATLVTRVRGQGVGAQLLFARQDSDVSWHAWLQRLQLQLGASVGSERWRVMPGYVIDRFDDRPAPGIHRRVQYAVLAAQATLDRGRRWLAGARLERAHATPTLLSPAEDRSLAAVSLAREVGASGRVSLEWANGGRDGARAARPRLALVGRVAF